MGSEESDVLEMDQLIIFPNRFIVYFNLHHQKQGRIQKISKGGAQNLI